MSQNRKTYARVDIGRIDLEGGWFPGEDYSLEVSLCSWHKGMKYLCLVYLQVAKLCVSVGVNWGPSKKAVAEWGEMFEAAARREPIAPKAEATPEEIENARTAARSDADDCDGPVRNCDGCPVSEYCSDGVDVSDRARAWLSERGIPIEAPEGEEVTE